MHIFMEGSNALTKENSILEQKAYLAAGQPSFFHFNAALVNDLNDLVLYFVTLKLLKTPKIHKLKLILLALHHQDF